MYNVCVLKIFRKKIVSKIILWGLLILILPAFVMWGSASMSRSKDKGPTYVGMVHNKKISFEQFYNALAGIRSQIILTYFNQPKILDTILSNKPLLAKLAWDRLLMLEEVRRLKIKVSDKEVIGLIRSHPLFLRKGAFDDAFYSYVLRNNIGLELRAFEEAVRDNIALNKLTSLLTKDIKLSDSDILAKYKKDFEEFKIAYVLLEPKAFISNIKIDEKAVKDFFENHKSELMMKSNLKGAIPDRLATFEESKDSIENYLKEAEAKKTLSQKADEIRKKLLELIENKAETFGRAAEKLSLNVKDTGLFSAKDNVEEIDNVPIIAREASALKEFELSKPIEINKGFIILEVVQKKSADEEKFKKDKEEYSKKALEERSDEYMAEWLHKVEDESKLAIKLEEIEKYYR